MGLYTVRIYAHLFLNDRVEDTVGCLPNIYFSDSLSPPLSWASPSSSGRGVSLELLILRRGWKLTALGTQRAQIRVDMWQCCSHLGIALRMKPPKGVEPPERQRCSSSASLSLDRLFCVVMLILVSDGPVGHSVLKTRGS